MITSADLDEVLKRFHNMNYGKQQQDLTLQLKRICEESEEFSEYIMLVSGYAVQQNLTLVDAISREFLAGLIIGVILEKESKKRV